MRATESERPTHATQSRVGRIREDLRHALSIFTAEQFRRAQNETWNRLSRAARAEERFVTYHDLVVATHETQQRFIGHGTLGDSLAALLEGIRHASQHRFVCILRTPATGIPGAGLDVLAIAGDAPPQAARGKSIPMESVPAPGNHDNLPSVELSVLPRAS